MGLLPINLHKKLKGTGEEAIHGTNSFENIYWSCGI